jgi:hypothetical protein
VSASRERAGGAWAGVAAGLALAAALLWRCVLSRSVPARLDLADFFWPLKSYTAARWAAGGVPLWNPLSGCGEPWLAQLQTGVFYPGDVPFLLRWPYGPLAAIALHLAIAAAGMAAWLYDLGASRVASLLSAAVYAGGGAFLSLFPVYNNACSAAYIPWIFLGARRLVRGESLVMLTAGSALAFLAGEPALALAASAAASLVAVATRREGETGGTEPLRRAAGRLAGALALAFGLAAITALPFAEHVLRTGRLASITRGEALARPVGASELADLVVPQRSASSQALLPERGGYLLTLALGPGPLLLACGCAAGFPGRRRLLALLFLLGLAGAVVALGAAGRVAPGLYDMGLLRMRFPARWIVFGHLFLAIAAGAGLDGWLHGRFLSRSARVSREGETTPPSEDEPYGAAPALFTALLGFAGIALLACLAWRDLALRAGPRLALVLSSSALVTLGIAFARRGADSRRLAPWIALAAVLPLPMIAADPLDAAPASTLVGTPAVLAARSGKAEGRVFVPLHDPSLLADWIASSGPSWRPDIATRAHAALAGYANLTCGVATATSPSPIGNPRVTRLLGAALQGGNPAALLALADVGAVVTPFQARIPGARLDRRLDGVSRYELPGRVGRVFFARSVEVADDDTTFAALRRPDFDPEARAYVADSSAPLPRTSGPGYSVARVETDDPEELRVAVATGKPGFLVITRSFDPGWRATLDGGPVTPVRTDLAFLGLAVPAGQHRLLLRYRPASYRIGMWVSGISCLVFISFWLAGGPRR